MSNIVTVLVFARTIGKSFYAVLTDGWFTWSQFLKVTMTGGWCRSDFSNGHVTDHNLAAALAFMFRRQTVASFGDGPDKQMA